MKINDDIIRQFSLTGKDSKVTDGLAIGYIQTVSCFFHFDNCTIFVIVYFCLYLLKKKQS